MPDYRVGDEISVKVNRWLWPPWEKDPEERSSIHPVWAKNGDVTTVRVFDAWNDHADGRQRVRVWWSGEAWPRASWWIVGEDVRPQSAIDTLGDLAR